MAPRKQVAKKQAEPQGFRFRVLVDNYVPAKQGSVVTREPDENTAALVTAGVLEPLSKAAAEATSEDES